MSDAAEPPFVWCPVANMIDERCAGPGGVEVWHGTKHFRPGAKLYLWPYVYNSVPIDRIMVFGKHRNGPRYIETVVRLDWLENLRVQAIYNPFLYQKLVQWWDWQDNCERAERLLTEIQRRLSYHARSAVG